MEGSVCAMRAGRRNERFGKGHSRNEKTWRPACPHAGLARLPTVRVPLDSQRRRALPRRGFAPAPTPARAGAPAAAARARQRVGVAHAQQQAAAGPVVGQRDQADGHGARVRLGGQPRQDADAAGGRHHAADRVETADLDAQLHRPAQPAAFLGQPRRQRGRRRQAHVVVGQRVGEGDASLAGQRMALRHDQHQLVAPVRCGDEAGRGRAVGEDADVGAVLLDGGDDVVAILFFQVDAHGRMRFHEGGQVLGQELGQRRGVGGNAHLSAHALGKVGQGDGHLLHFLQHAQRVHQTGLAGLGQLDAGGVAVEQLGVQRGLQVGDALAGRAHGQVRLTRAGRDAALAGHRDE